MNFNDFITGVCDEARVNRNIGTTYDRVVREINRVTRDIWNSFPWSFRWKNYRFVTDSDVTAGTVTATNGSRTLTGSSTTFLSTHVGWHIYFPGDSVQQWYKILNYTSATSVQLDVPYQGTTGSGKSYVLRHFDYTLPTEAWDIGSITATANNRPLNILEPSSADLLMPMATTNGAPEAVSLFGMNSSHVIYSAGTVSGTSLTKTITGSGTSFLGNVSPGDELWFNIFGDATHYTIESVDSDTQLTLYNLQLGTNVAAAYQISRQLARFMRILWPSTTKHVIDLRAARLYSDMIQGLETNELITRYPDMITKNVACTELSSLGDVRKRELKIEALKMLNDAKAEDQYLTDKNNAAPIYTYRQSRGGISWR